MIHFADTFLRLRKEKHLTQTEVAEHLGVTKASVSKWETGQTLPDVSLLPLIASFFDVTLDKLFDYHPTLSPEQIQARYKAYCDDFAENPFEAVFPKLKEEVHRYYSDYRYLYQIAILLLNHYPAAIDPAESALSVSEVHEFTLQLCKRVEENGADPLLCENAHNVRMMIELQNRNFSYVIEELSDLLLPDRVTDMASVLVTAYTASGNLQEADRAAQISIYRSLLTIFGHTLNRMRLQVQDERALCEHIRRAEAIMDAYDLIHLHPNTAGAFYYQALLLRIQAAENPSEQSLLSEAHRLIERFCQSAVILFANDLCIHGDSYFPDITEWFQGNSMGSVAVRNKKEVLQSVLEGFDHPALQIMGTDFLQKRKEELRRQCEKYL
ncbi:MAG: helix-turn-helix transcriptional regulator [Lachnospiraceae bacterium]|nr:helix-turn-helix transcriptional regulator [Lachnospiraceae bacterium]